MKIITTIAINWEDNCKNIAHLYQCPKYVYLQAFIKAWGIILTNRLIYSVPTIWQINAISTD